MIFLYDLRHVSWWLGLCFLHFVVYNLYVLKCFVLRGKGKEKDRAKLETTDELPNWEMIWQLANLFFSPSLTLYYSLCFRYNTNTTNNNRKTTLELLIAFNFFQCPRHCKLLLTSDLAINFLVCNIFAILY